MKYFIILILNSFLLCSYYEIGDVIELEHQAQPIDICYGEYPSDEFRLLDMNYNMNGNNPKITVIRSSWPQYW